MRWAARSSETGGPARTEHAARFEQPHRPMVQSVDIQLGQVIAALAVPVLGLVGAMLQRDRTPARHKGLREAAQALKDAPPDSSAFKALDELVAAEARAVLSRTLAMGERQLNYANVVLSVVLTIIVGLIMLGLFNWASSTWGQPISWLVVPLASLVGVFLAVVIAAAFGTIYNPRTPSTRKSKGA